MGVEGPTLIYRLGVGLPGPRQYLVLCVDFGGRSLRVFTTSFGRTSSSSPKAILCPVDAKADECEEKEEGDDDDEDDEISLHLGVRLNKGFCDVGRLPIV